MRFCQGHCEGSLRRAFTIIELLVAIVIIVILAAIIFKGVPFLRDRAEGVKCGQNMKSLQTSLATYLQDNGHWPQEPKELWMANDSNAYEDWWIQEMKPYGATDKVWQCPTIVRRITSKREDGRPKMHYTPTMFDANPFTPYKWSTQPWLIEIGNMHGAGALVCFPDGSIKSMTDVSAGN